MKYFFFYKLSLLIASFLVSYLISAQDVNPEIDSIINLISIENYKSHFDSIRTNETSNRKVTIGKKQSEDHDACRDYILRRFQDCFGHENAYIHHFRSELNGGLSNVLGFKKGENSSLGIWVISAHYDSNNNNERNLSERLISPGANDNGTGVAAILEIARIISKLDIKASILFAAWDFEEVFTNGYPTGSNNWYKKFVKTKKNTDWQKIGQAGIINKNDITGNINFDMFGNPQSTIDEKPVLWACYASNRDIEFVDNYTKTLNRYINNITVITHGRLTLSDHYTFSAKKIPAVENLESNYSHDPYYHTYSDNYSNKNNIDFSFATNVTRGGLAFILENAILSSNNAIINGYPKTNIAVHESPDYYLFKYIPINSIFNIYNDLGLIQDYSIANVGLSFAPKTEGLYNVQILNSKGLTKKTFLFKMKEGPMQHEPFFK